MPRRPSSAPAAQQRAVVEAAVRRPAWHVHWFRRMGDDAFSGAGLYACRCGVVRPGF